ncbi:MAG: hypothetical protein AB7E76_14265 [Deferribacterales bacterium]
MIENKAEEKIEENAEEKPNNCAFMLQNFCIKRDMSLKDLVGLVITFSFMVSIVWHTLFFKDIHTVPSSTDGVAVWILLGVSVFGFYIIFIIMSLFFLPTSIISGLKLHENNIIHYSSILLLRLAPYFFLFSVVSPTSVSKITTTFIFYSTVVLVVFLLNKRMFKKIPEIILFLFFSFFANASAIYIFSSSIKTEKPKSFILMSILAIIFVLQIMYELLKKKKEGDVIILPVVMFIFTSFIFISVIPRFQEGYNFPKIILVAPYSVFNIGYYSADIIVSKDSYNMIKAISKVKEIKNDTNTYKIENAFILFSLGTEYIISVCKEKVDETKIGDKYKYRQYVVKASKDKNIMPSSYTYEFKDWEVNQKGIKINMCCQN